MGCGEFIVKYILFFANLFFALAGLALLGLGIAVQLQISVITDVFDGSYQIAPILTIVVGAVIFFIAFLGCCGSIRESNCLLVTYAIFMIILMVVKLTFAILLFVNLSGFKESIGRVLSEAFARDQRAFDPLQRTFSCCGANGALDYGLQVTLPESCCVELIGGYCTIANANKGCTQVLTDFFDVFGTAIGAIAIVVVSVELVAVVFSLCLANHARNKQRRNHY